MRAYFVLPLLLAGAWTGALSDELRATPRPPPGPAAALGGFSAVAVQVLWMRGDAALRGNRLPEALYYFRAIETLEPQMVAASSYFADEVGRNMADREPDDQARAALGMLAVGILDRAVRQNPDVAAARTARGAFLGTRIARDDAQAKRFLEQRGVAPFTAARDDYRKAAQLDPSSIEAHEGLFICSFECAVRQFVAAFTDGDPQAAGDADASFVEAAEAAAESARLSEEVYGKDPRMGEEAAGRLETCRRFVEVIRAEGETRRDLYRRLRQDFDKVVTLPALR